MSIAKVTEHIHANKERHIEELCEFLRIPSISAKSEHKEDVRRAAGFLLEQFNSMGFECELMETPGHPVVYAEYEGRPGAATLLIYGHYDVQPVDPLNEWRHPPFEPVIEDGNIVARGSSDDKGQLFTHIKSAEAFIKQVGGLPVNLKYVIEGEEEIASAHLEDFLRREKARLGSDCAVISDTSQFARGVPAITYGLRGLSYFQIDVRGSSRDLHSGSYGGTVANPANVLAQIVARLRDETGRILVPGFYDDVRELEPWEREQFAELPFDEEEYRASIGAPNLHGEPGYTTLERRWARPTLDVNGIVAGYTGEGAKTVIPACASAKVSMRLVPDQDPERIGALFRDYVRAISPACASVEVTEMHGAKPCIAARNTREMQAAIRAIEKSFGKKPAFIRDGGTIPVVASLKEELGLDTLLLGWGLPDDAAHAPNEKFCIEDFHRGILASAHLFWELGQ